MEIKATSSPVEPVKRGDRIPSTPQDLARVPVGTLLVDVQGYPLVKHEERNGWAIWAADEARWILYSGEEVLGMDEPSNFFPAVVSYVPGDHAPLRVGARL